MKIITIVSACIIAFVSHFSGNNLFAQAQSEELSLNKSSLPKQIDYIIKKSTDYEDNKVVKTGWLYVLRAHVVDSIKAYETSVAEAKLMANQNVQLLDSFKTELLAVQEKLTSVESEKNSMNFIGIQMSKSAYNSFVWIIIGVLSIGLVIFILLYKRGIAITHEAKVTLEETRLEFESHRKKTLERIEKLGVEHLNEMNKLKSKYQSNFPNAK